MCGRAAQTSDAVVMAAQSLLRYTTTTATATTTNSHQDDSNTNINNSNENNKNHSNDNDISNTKYFSECIEQMKSFMVSSSLSLSSSNDQENNTESSTKATSSSSSHEELLSICNYNMSPGMEAIVFWYDHDNEKQQLCMGKKVWGLIPRGGTVSSPLPDGMAKHFEGLMFNARSDTLYEKSTFTRLARSKKTCIIALNGYFEWKSELKGRKQPYYVYRNQQKDDNNTSSSAKENNHNSNTSTTKLNSYLLIAGLWTRVQTGKEDPAILDTFSMITTEVCSSIQWLHSRMPVIVSDIQLAYQWLMSPSEHVHQLIYESSQQLPNDYLSWHAVTPDMTSMKFRKIDAIKPLPKMKTVKSFFTNPTITTTTTSGSNSKSSLSTTTNNKSSSLSSSTIMKTASTSIKPTPITTTTPSSNIKNHSIKNQFISSSGSNTSAKKRSMDDMNNHDDDDDDCVIIIPSSPLASTKKTKLITSTLQTSSSKSTPKKTTSSPAKKSGTLLNFFKPK